jgi:NtrC-family two-component system sensor histidine kinase KinB
MGLRLKILLGFLILATMLFVAGAWSIYELSNIGISVQNILDENYKSSDAAKSMTEALEREDSAILLLLLGKRKEGREFLRSADNLFEKAFETVRNNVTIPGEQEYVDTIRKNYNAYKALWAENIAGTVREGDLEWYFRDVHLSFLMVKGTVKKLMDLNDRTMYKTAFNLEGRAHRATMPGIIAMVSAFIFAVIFSFLINLLVVSPIIRITGGIQEYLETGKSFNVKIETGDELSHLVASVESLIERSKR